MADSTYLIIIGAMKAGTTSLFHILDSHPDICGSFEKEPNFFCEPWHRRVHVTDYDDLWPESKNRDFRYLMEASACYTNPPLSGGVPAAIEQYLAEKQGAKVKFLYCVRNPVERIASHVNWAVGFSWFDPKASVTSARYYGTSHYYEQIKPYLDRFPREDFHLVDFNELAKEPRKVGAEICAFLGIDDAIDYEGTINPRNTTKKETVAERLVLRSAIGNRAFKSLPFRVRLWLRHKVFPKFPSVSKIVIDPAQEAELRAVLRDDMQQFKQALGVDVTKWGF
ncbi:MAG: sulfotransferase [Pseudomonadota bacterium]